MKSEAREKKALALAMGAALLLFVIMGIVIVFMFLDKNSQPVEPDGVVQTGRSEQFGGWGEYIVNRDANGLIEMTNRQIESTDDVEAKSNIYASRAGVLYSFDFENGSTEYGAQILADVYSAEEYYPTGSTAYSIYVYEQIYGDPVVAEEYLKLAEERGATIPPGRG